MRDSEPSSKDQIDGIKAARDYMWKQTWDMKWVTLLVSGLMATYVIQTGSWIPFLELDIIPWILAMVGYFVVQISASGGFITLERLKKLEDTVDTRQVSSRLYLYAWFMLGIQVIVIHWCILVVYANLTAPV